MKKLLKLFGLLLAMGTLFCLSSCDDLLGLNGENTPTKQEIEDEYYNNPINHTFVKDNTTVGNSFIYYNSTTKFSYTNHDSCYYQMSFNVGKKTWQIYTRTTSSVTKIEDVSGGTFTGNPSAEGDLVLTSSDVKSASQTVTIKKNDDGTLYFVGNVAASHKAIGAKDAK